MNPLKFYPAGTSVIACLKGKTQLTVGCLVTFVSGSLIHSYTIQEVKENEWGYVLTLSHPLGFAISYGDVGVIHPPKKPDNQVAGVKKTHYSYLSGPNFMREPTGLLDLSAASVETRRKLIHSLISNGELVASLPSPEIRDMVSLRKTLAAQEEKKRQA